MLYPLRLWQSIRRVGRWRYRRYPTYLYLVVCFIQPQDIDQISAVGARVVLGRNLVERFGIRGNRDVGELSDVLLDHIRDHKGVVKSKHGRVHFGSHSRPFYALASVQGEMNDVGAVELVGDQYANTPIGFVLRGHLRTKRCKAPIIWCCLDTAEQIVNLRLRFSSELP